MNVYRGPSLLKLQGKKKSPGIRATQPWLEPSLHLLLAVYPRATDLIALISFIFIGSLGGING